jgi:hypothetical protein
VVFPSSSNYKTVDFAMDHNACEKIIKQVNTNMVEFEEENFKD